MMPTHSGAVTVIELSEVSLPLSASTRNEETLFVSRFATRSRVPSSLSVKFRGVCYVVAEEH
jgi:hypothetical protein